MAEDDVRLAEVLRESLAESGWETEVVHDGRAAYDALLTDAGWDVVVEAAPGHVETVRRHLVDALTPEQLVALGEISEAILRSVPAAREMYGLRED